MRDITFKHFAFSCLVMFMCAGCTSGTQVKPLKPIHVATGEWAPFVSQNLENNGPVAQMISTILIELDFIPTFKYYDWGSVHTHLNTGYPSFAFPYMMGNDTLEYKYSDPIIDLDYVLFFYSEDGGSKCSFDSLDDIVKAGKTIGRIKGYTKLPWIEDDSAYEEVSSSLDGFRMLADGKIDFLMEARHAGELLTKSDKILADASNFGYLGKSDSLGEKDDTTFVSKLSFRIKFSSMVSDEFISSINHSIESAHKTIYYQNLIDKINNPKKESWLAYLKDSDSSLIYGYSGSSVDKFDYILPASTKVVVVEWNRIFCDKITLQGENYSKLRSKVKVLNGPLNGKIVWIENRNIFIKD